MDGATNPSALLGCQVGSVGVEKGTRFRLFRGLEILEIGLRLGYRGTGPTQDFVEVAIKADGARRAAR
jgi:hypothetical protein